MDPRAVVIAGEGVLSLAGVSGYVLVVRAVSGALAAGVVEGRATRNAVVGISGGRKQLRSITSNAQERTKSKSRREQALGRRRRVGGWCVEEGETSRMVRRRRAARRGAACCCGFCWREGVWIVVGLPLLVESTSACCVWLFWFG